MVEVWASIIGGVPMDSEDALTDLSVQGFHLVVVPFFKVLFYKRTPHFITIK